MSKQTHAFILIGICCAMVLGQEWLFDEDYQAPWFVWIPTLGVLAWSLWQLREKPDPSSKTFDFNPRRGVLFFILGFLIFPFMLGMEAIFATDISLATAGLVTLGGSLLVGLIGTFTEHVGI